MASPFQTIKCFISGLKANYYKQKNLSCFETMESGFWTLMYPALNQTIWLCSCWLNILSSQNCLLLHALIILLWCFLTRVIVQQQQFSVWK